MKTRGVVALGEEARPAARLFAEFTNRSLTTMPEHAAAVVCTTDRVDHALLHCLLRSTGPIATGLLTAPSYRSDSGRA